MRKYGDKWKLIQHFRQKCMKTEKNGHVHLAQGTSVHISYFIYNIRKTNVKVNKKCDEY